MSVFKKRKLSEKVSNEEEGFSCLSPLKETEKLLIIQNELCIKLDNLKFKPPVEYVYNPLKYAKNVHETFIKKYFENSKKKIMFLGMNPGPWGMCQTGIAFGEKNYVKEWLGITGIIETPAKEHPKKKITGFNCHRSEISGRKFWEFFKRLCKTPENFFKHSFVYNFCPLAFMEISGKNITPPEIKDKNIRKQLYDICNEAFIRIIKAFNFEIVIGIGKFAEKNATYTLKSNGIVNVKVFSIPHPSPRNAISSLNWEQNTLSKLQEFNLIKYFNEESEIMKNLS